MNSKNQQFSSPAYLQLEDSTVFTGFSFGSSVNNDGEVVFNTGMVGYPESLTDPSYRGQILTYTYPLIGNYGVPDKKTNKFESDKIQVRGVIVSQYEHEYSHHEARLSLHEWLSRYDIPAITGIDTRALTKRLREHGVMLGKIVQGKPKPTDLKKKKINIEDPSLTNIVTEVSVQESVWCAKKNKYKIYY